MISTNADPATGRPLVSGKDGRRHWEILPRSPRRAPILLWLRGSYRRYTDYDLEVVGLLPQGYRQAEGSDFR